MNCKLNACIDVAQFVPDFHVSGKMENFYYNNIIIFFIKKKIIIIKNEYRYIIQY